MGKGIRIYMCVYIQHVVFPTKYFALLALHFSVFLGVHNGVEGGGVRFTNMKGNVWREVNTCKHRYVFICVHIQYILHPSVFLI